MSSREGFATKREEGEEEEPMSLEEMAKYRQTAQRNSIEAIRAAQERYYKAKDAAPRGVCEAAEKGSAARDAAVEKGRQGYQAAKEYAQQAATVVSEKGAAAKEATVENGSTAYEAAKSYTQQAVEKAKDATASAGKGASEHTHQVAGKAMGATVSTGKSAAGHASVLAERAKDATVVTGKSTAEYVRDEAAEFTTEKATKAKDSSAQKAEEDRGAAGGDERKDGEQKATGEEEREEGEVMESGETEVNRAQPEEQVKENYGEDGAGQAVAAELWELSVGEGKPSTEAEEHVSAGINEGAEALHGAGHLAEEGAGAASGGVGGLFEAVGVAVIGVAQSARELIMGREPGRRGR